MHRSALLITTVSPCTPRTTTPPRTSSSPPSHLADLRHLCLCDVAVLVHVEQREGPLQLARGLARGGHVQRDDVLLEVQRSVVVGVERAEDVLGVGGGVALREEAGVDGLELLRADAARGTLLLEVLVPLADLVLRELGVELQVLQDLLGDGAAGGVSHLAGFDCS